MLKIYNSLFQTIATPLKFKRKTTCHSIMDNVNLHVHTNLIRKFSIFTVSNSVRSSPSARCVSTADNICHVLSVFDRNTVSLEDIVSMNKTA